MTEPGSVRPPAPGWWVRTESVGTVETGYQWETSAAGVIYPVGTASGTYGWVGSATGITTSSVFDSVGAGAASLTATLVWSHTIGASASCAMVGFTSTQSTVTSVTVGASAATRVGSALGFGAVFVHVFRVLAPPTGVQTVTVTLPAAGNNNGCSVAYRVASAVGALQTNTGTGTAMSITATSSIGQMVFQIFGHDGAVVASAYNQTQRYNNYSAGVAYSTTIGDAPGAATVPFTATAPSSNWAAAAVTVLP